MADYQDQANSNLEALAANTYPGRGIIIGCAEDGRSLLQLYWIMGRSENSRNRIFSVDGSTLKTEPLDPAKVEDPSLIIYAAMREVNGHYLVSNGDQTDTLTETIVAGGSYIDALRTRVHEPDAPNWTPRIAGGFELRKVLQRVWLAIVKADPTAPNRSQRNFFEYSDVPAGYGFCITTYLGDGSPLPCFRGEPAIVPLLGPTSELLEKYWGCLNEDNRISLALKSIDIGSGASQLDIINRYS